MPNTKRLHARSKNYRIRNEVKDMLDQLGTILLVDEFHAFCISTNQQQNAIHPMEMLDDLLSDCTAWEVICKTHHSAFNMTAIWFRFGKYNRVETLDEFEVREIIETWLDDIATWMVTDADAFGWIHSEWIKHYLMKERGEEE